MKISRIDLSHIQDWEHLLVMDYFSKYEDKTLLTEVWILATIKTLKGIFARFDIPKLFYSDNGLQYDNANSFKVGVISFILSQILQNRGISRLKHQVPDSLNQKELLKNTYRLLSICLRKLTFITKSDILQF